MKKTKRAYYNDIADVLKTLAHPERLAIIALLNDNRSALKVKDVYKRLDVSQPVASKHLGIMWRAGVLIKSNRGSNTSYAILPELKRVIRFVLKKNDFTF